MRQLSSPKDRSSSTPRVEEDPFEPAPAILGPRLRAGAALQLFTWFARQHHEGAAASVSAPDTRSVPEGAIVVLLSPSRALIEYLTNLNGILTGSLTVIFRIAA